MKKFICRHCHIPVISKTDHRPLLGYEHGHNCPRRFRQFHPNTRIKK